MFLLCCGFANHTSSDRRTSNGSRQCLNRGSQKGQFGYGSTGRFDSSENCKWHG